MQHKTFITITGGWGVQNHALETLSNTISTPDGFGWCYAVDGKN